MFDSRAPRARLMSYLIIPPRGLAQHKPSVIDSRQKEGREVGLGRVDIPTEPDRCPFCSRHTLVS